MNNILFQTSIINSYPELMPSIRRAPFDSKSLCVDISNNVEKAEEYFSSRFSNYVICEKGRDAIDLALSQIDLRKNDVVTILTTSGNFYISGCVTNTIEKHCKWSRKIEHNTKAIFVNHEFGYNYEDVKSLRKYNVPIIEDCACAMFSSAGNIGKEGDYAVYSLTKSFSIRLGGILACNSKKIEVREINSKYVLSGINEQIDAIPNIISKRISNYNYYVNELAHVGIRPFFPLKIGVTPEVFLFSWDADINYQKLKTFMQYNGVESSVFYGKSAFFVPVHDNLSETELRYICNLLLFFKANYT